MYGFAVDLNTYKDPVWYNAVVSNCYRDSSLIGVCTTNIGVTRAKSKASGKYMDQVMIRNIMKGRNPKKGWAGYSEQLTVQSTLPSGTALMAYSPTQLASSISYDVGVSASNDKTAGISASTTITKNALEIKSYSDTAARLFKVCYDYQHSIFRPAWRIHEYSYNESVQTSHYVIQTAASKYFTKIVVIPQFQLWSAEPGYWANQYNWYSTLTHTISFTTPY